MAERLVWRLRTHGVWIMALGLTATLFTFLGDSLREFGASLLHRPGAERASNRHVQGGWRDSFFTFAMIPKTGGI